MGSWSLLCEVPSGQLPKPSASRGLPQATLRGRTLSRAGLWVDLQAYPVLALTGSGTQGAVGGACSLAWE